MVKLRRALDKALNWLVIVLLVFLLIVTSAQVFWRYVLNSPLGWSEELARYTFVWLVFLGAGIAFRDNKHMAVDLIEPLLSPKLRKVQRRVVQFILLTFSVVLVTVSPRILSITLDQPTASLSIPMAFIYVAFPVSVIISALYIIFDILGVKGDTKP